MPTVRQLVTTWGFDIDKKPLQAMESAISDAKNTALTLTATITGVGAAIFALARSSVSTAIDLKNTSAALNANTEDLQAMQYAAKLAGISTGELDQMLMSVQTAAMQAAYGTGEVKTGMLYMTEGIRDANGEIKQTPGMLIDVLKNLNKIQSASDKRFITQDLFAGLSSKAIEFGKTVQNMEQMREAAKTTGHVLSTDALNGAAAFNKTMVDLQDRLSKLRFELGTAFLPLVARVVTSIGKWVDANKGLLRKDLESVIWGLGEAFKWLEQHLTVKRLKEFARVVEGIYLAKVVAGVGQLALNIANLGVAVLAFLATPIGLIVAIGAAIVGVGIATGKLHTADLKRWADNVGKWLLSAKVAFEDFVANFQTNHPIIAGLLESLEGAFAKAFDAISETLAKFSSNSDGELGNLQESGGKFSTWLASFSKDVKASDIETFGVGLTRFINALSNNAGDILDDVSRAFHRLGEAIREEFPWLVAVAGKLEDLGHLILKAGSTGVRKIGESLSEGAQALDDRYLEQRTEEQREQRAFSLENLLSDKPGQILKALNSQGQDYPGPLRGAGSMMQTNNNPQFHFTFNVSGDADLDPAKARDFATQVKSHLDNDALLTYAQIAPTYDKKG